MRERGLEHRAGATEKGKGMRAALAHLCIAISAIVLFKPIFFYGSHYLLVGLVASAIGLLGLFVCLSRNNGLRSPVAIRCAGFWLLLKLWQITPFRDNNAIGFGILYAILVGLFFFLHPDDKRSVLESLQLVFGVLGVLSALVVILLALGVELPYYLLEGGVRAEKGVYFYIYPGAVVMRSQVFPGLFGGTWVRSSGIFVEPGHFGVVAGLLAASNGLSLRSLSSKLVFLGGLSTFSGSFFAIVGCAMVALTVVRAKAISANALKWYAMTSVGLAFMGFLFLASPAEFQDRVLWNRAGISDDQDVFTGRGMDEFNQYFDQYKSEMKSLVGLGNQLDFTTSDWRAEVMRYGWLVFLFYGMLLLAMYARSRAPTDVKMGVFCAMAIVVMHRLGYLDTFLVIAFSRGGAQDSPGGGAKDRRRRFPHQASETAEP